MAIDIFDYVGNVLKYTPRVLFTHSIGSTNGHVLIDWNHSSFSIYPNTQVDFTKKFEGNIDGLGDIKFSFYWDDIYIKNKILNFDMGICKNFEMKFDNCVLKLNSRKIINCCEFNDCLVNYGF